MAIAAFVVTIVLIAAAVTVIGHGIWVLVARLFAASDSGTSRQPGAPPGDQLLADRAATKRQLDQLHRRGLIHAATYWAMRRALDAARPGAPPPTAVPLAPDQQGPVSPEVAPPSAVDAAPVSPAPAGVDGVAAGDTATPAPAPAPPVIATPRPSRQILAAFMQEKNIRWGQLVGGMLILFSSIALVVSLWSQIAAIPVLKFFIFTAVTAGLFGAGFYTERRWKLPTTSRGVLTLSMLLVPLNFLAIAAFSREQLAWDPVVLGGEVAAVLIFGVLVLLAGRVIVPAWSILLTASLIGVCLCQLLIRRFADESTGLSGLTVLVTLLLVCYAAPAAVITVRGRRWRALGARRGQGVLTVLALVSFAAMPGLGLLIYVADIRVETLRQLAPILCLYGAPALFTGLLLWHRVKARHLATLHTIGTSVAIVGALMTLATVALALRLPWSLLVTGVLAGVVLTTAALSFRIAAMHVPAALSLTLAYLAAWHVAAGRLEWQDGAKLIGAFLSGESGVALVWLSMLSAVVTGAFYALRRSSEARWYGWITGAIAAVSLLLATLFGFGRLLDPHGAMWVYAFYAAAALVGAHLTGRRLPALIGSVLMLAALVQGFAFRHEIHLAWPRAMLAHATLATIIGMAWQRTASGTAVAPKLGRAGAMLTSAQRTSECAAILLLLAPSFGWASYPWPGALWLAAVWFVLAMQPNAVARFAGAQVALTIAVAWAVGAHLQAQHPWFVERKTWLHPWHVQWLATAIALLSLLWIAVRLGLHRLLAEQPARPWLIHLHRLSLGRHGVSVDRIMIFAATAVAVSLATWGAAPGIAVELSGYASQSPASAPLSALALGWGSWLLLFTLLAVCFADLWQRPTRWPMLGVVILGCSACLLLAGRWSDQVAAASMLRWSLAALLLLGAIPVWWRRRVGEVAMHLGQVRVCAALPEIARPVMPLLGSLTIIPILLFTAIVAARWSEGRSMAAPEAGFFRQIGHVASYTLPLVLAAAVMIGQAVRDKSRLCLSVMTLLVNAAATIWWIVHWRQTSDLTGIAAVAQCARINVIALAVAGLAALAIEARLWHWAQNRPNNVAPHQFVAMLALLVLVVATATALVGDAFEKPLAGTALPAWSALLAVAALLIACLWDALAVWALPAIYAVGLLAVGMLLDGFDLSQRWLLWWAAMATAGYAVLTSGLWAARGTWLPWTEGLRLPEHADASADERRWLVTANLTAAVAVAAVSCWVVRTFSGEALVSHYSTALLMRLAGAAAVLVAAVAVALLARGIDRSALRPATLALAAVGALIFGLAWITPDSPPDRTINLAVVTMAVLAAVTSAYGVGLVKVLPVEQPWHLAAKRILPQLFAATVLSLLAVMIAELVHFFFDGGVAMAWPAILATVAVLLGLTVIMLTFAMAPGADPLNLSARGRMGYVYAAEATVGLLVLHIRLTMPWLFHGFFTQYWPLIAMAVAFVGVGLSEWFGRQGQLVLARPLERTGVFLPLLPVLGFWFVGSKVDYAGLLVVVGMLYAALSLLRASFGFGVIAALAANGALWSLLHRTAKLGLFDHPQVWMIPPALSVLAATYLNRKRLTPEQTTATRYTCLMVIYVSSTADIMIQGVTNSLWLPLVLMALSVAGVMIGIGLRLRSYLYLGTAFLMLSLLTMIRFASVNLGWTWLWYVAGIVLGLAIIAVFALFEKHRGKALHMIEELKAWQQ